MNMDAVVLCVTSTNTLALLALAFRAGQLVNKLAQAEKRILDLEGAKTEIAIARFDEKLSHVNIQMGEMRDEWREFAKGFRTMWQQGAAPPAPARP
jgi:hypothetical protein